MSDNVEKPAHYNQGSVETIDGIRAALGVGFLAYCLGNVLKYVWRCQSKGKLLEDLRKAAKYLEWAIQEAEKLEPKSEVGNCPEIPEGWRELNADEVPSIGDRYECCGGWMFRGDDATCEYEWYDVRHIRKLEPNSSETPKSSAWVPKVGDKVRVIKPRVVNDSNPHWHPEMDQFDGRLGEVSKAIHKLGVVLIDGFEDRDGYQWRFSFDWLVFEGSKIEAAK